MFEKFLAHWGHRIRVRRVDGSRSTVRVLCVDCDVVLVEEAQDPGGFEFERISAHVGHDVEIGVYGPKGERPPDNVAIECMDCYEVLRDYTHGVDGETCEVLNV